MHHYGGNESEEEMEYSDDEKALKEYIKIPTWQEYIEQYRGSLLNTLETHYKDKVEKDFLKERVAILFPDENFYFFQLKENNEE